MVKVAHPGVTGGLNLTMGLDRFGRVADQRWIDTSSGDAVDRFQYTYDRDGNVVTKTALNGNFNETYSYDNLNRLADFARGSHTQAWTLDALGNMNTVTTDGTDEDRTVNAANEITSISDGWTTAYDNNGNTTTDDTGRQFVYDAWNRLVIVEDTDNYPLETMTYDGAGRKVTTAVVGGTTTAQYYSDQWQVVEERQIATGIIAAAASEQYVWSPVYVDAMIERDRDADNDSQTGANGLEERLYAQQDANYSVASISDGTFGSQTQGQIVERYVEDPFGKVMLRHPIPGALAAAIFAPNLSPTVDKKFLPQSARMERPSAGTVTPPGQRRQKPPP